jgi:predicted metalloenzyme YecM
MLLPGAVDDAEYNQVLDERLVSVMLSLANSFIAEGSIDKARKLYEDLIQLKKSIKSYESLDNLSLEQIALQHLSARTPEQIQSTWSNSFAKVRNLILSMMAQLNCVYVLK